MRSGFFNLAVLSVLCLGAVAYGQRIAIPAGFPNASTTGIAGVGLTADDLTPTSGRTITVDGTVIEEEDVAGRLTIDADNVTIRRSRITGGGFNIRVYGVGTLIEDCTLIGAPGDAVNVMGGNYTIRRCDISGAHDGLKLSSGMLVEDCYIHDQYREDGTHNDGMQDSGDSTGWVVRHNTVQGPYQTSTSAMIISTSNGPIDNITIEENFLSGGSFTVYCSAGDYGAPTNATFRYNVFEKDSSGSGSPITFSGTPTFVGNIYHTGEPIPQNPLTNQPPVAKPGRTITVTDADGDGSETVTLDGTGSHDNDGTIDAYVWTENLAAIATGAVATLTLPVGSHTVDLTATDDDGATNSEGVLVLVLPAAGNQAPVADAGPHRTLVDTDQDGSEAITLDATASLDPDGTIAAYAWTENGTAIATGETPTVTLDVNAHALTLTVTDDAGATDTDTVVITVDAPVLARTIEVYGLLSDRVVYSDGSMRPAGDLSHRVGGGAAIFPLQLPALNPGEVVTDASFKVNLVQIRTGVVFNVSLYGLPYRTIQGVQAIDFYQDVYDGDPNATALQDDFATPASAIGWITSDASAALAAYLNAQIVAGAQAGDFVFLRLNADTTTPGSYKYYTVNSADSSDMPVLTIQTGPAVQPSVPGDADGDGDVDLDDFVILKTTFGQHPLVDSRADFDGDGDVDLDDFVILKNNFGQSIASASIEVQALATAVDGANGSGVPAPIQRGHQGSERFRRFRRRSIGTPTGELSAQVDLLASLSVARPLGMRRW